MGKTQNIDPKLMKLRRSMVDKFKYDESNPHPELKKKKKKSKNKNVPLMRRDKRKLAKQLKKARRIAYATHQPLSNLYAEILSVRPAKEKSVKEIVVKDVKEKIGKEDIKKRNALEKQERRMREMHQKIEEDEQEIKLYAKRLKLNKRKSKSLPKSFVDDGLAYLLEICDSAQRPTTSNKLSDVEDDLSKESVQQSDQDDFAVEPKPTKQKNAKGKESASSKRVRFADDEDFCDDFHSNYEIETSSDECSENIKNDEEQADETEDLLKEDIYGRLKDKQGNIIKDHEKLLPIRKVNINENAMEGSSGKKQVLVKLLKSLMNRLGEANVQFTVSKIQEVYQTHSRNDVKEILTDTIFRSCLRSDRVPDRLILEYVLLLAFIHSKVSTEITSFLVENLALKLKSLHDVLAESSVDKSLDNVVAFFAHMFTFKIVQSKLIFDVLKFLTETFFETDIELILYVLQTIGSGLRKENPLALKNIIDEVNLKSHSDTVQSLANQSRVKFLLETLHFAKNNNFLKVTNYDTSLSEHFLKLLRGSMSGKALEAPLPMSLYDLFSAATNGRWWIIGSAVIVQPHSNTADVPEIIESDWPKMVFSEDLLKLAKNLHMNTELRRNIFCIIMSSEDYLDAFEKLSKLSLKDQQEREIIHIALNCSLQEKAYNPFYSYLIQRFCVDQPRFVLTTQYAIWDKMKIVDELTSNRIDIFALLLSHLFARKVLPLTVLKVVEFARMSAKSERFLRTLFNHFLLDANIEDIRSSFVNCQSQKKFQSFLEGVKFFLNHVLLKEVDNNSGSGKLLSRISMVNKWLYLTENGSVE